MSSSSKPKIRNQFAKHLNKKTNNELKIQSSTLFTGEKMSAKNSLKRKVSSVVGFEKRRKTQLGDEFLAEKGVKNSSLLSDFEGKNVGFGVLGKRFNVPNCSSSSSEDSEETVGFKVLGERIGKKGSFSKNESVSRLRTQVMSNVVKDKIRKHIWSSSSSEDEGGFGFSGKRVVKKGSCSKKARVSRLETPFVSSVVKVKNTKPVSSSSSSEDEGRLGFSGKRVVKKSSCSKKARVSRLGTPSVSNVVKVKNNKPVSSSSSSEDDDDDDDDEEEIVGFEVLGEKSVRNGSLSKNASYSRFRTPLVSNKVRSKSSKPVRSSSSSANEGGLGKKIVKNGSCLKKVSDSRVRAPVVSNKVRGKNIKPVGSSFGSANEGGLGKKIVKNGSCSKKASDSRVRKPLVSNVLRGKNIKLVSSSSSSANEGGLGEKIVKSGSCSKKARIPLVSNVVRGEKTKYVSSSFSSADEGGLGETIVKNSFCLKKASDSRVRIPLVSNVVRGMSTGSVLSVGAKSTLGVDGFVENVGGDSDESMGRFDKKNDEIELSSDGEEDEDAAETESEEHDRLFSSDDDDSLDEPYSPSDNDVPSDDNVVMERMLRSGEKCSVNLEKDFAVEQNREGEVVMEKPLKSGKNCTGMNLEKDDVVERNENKRDIGVGGEENDIPVEEPLVSEKKCKRVNQKKDFSVELNKNKRDTGTGGKRNKENDAVVEKLLRSGNECKTVDEKKDSAVELNKEKRDNGIEVIVDFDNSSDEEERCSASREKDPQAGKFEQPKPMMESIAWNDDEPNSLKWECCNDSEKEERGSRPQKKDLQVGTFARVKPFTESEAPKDDESNSSKQECSSEKEDHCKEEVRKHRKSSARNAELITTLLNAVNEARNVDESVLIHEPLPLKFRFEDEVTNPPPQAKRDEEIESLFLELNYCLRIWEIDSADLSKNKNVDATSKMVDEGSAASCDQGVHDPVLDEQIGSVCRFCGVILLEIRDILPPWYTPCSKQQERKYFGEPLNTVNDELQSHNPVNGFNETMRVRGTVWDLIPGFQKDLFQHQCEGFEFLGKNIAGDIAIDKLPASLSGEGRGCMISHAPGTGKTRLAVVFLLSFLKRYPNACPVILAPQAILSTWENEFVKWKIAISFHNMNNPKLSGNETRFGGGTEVQGVRLAKLLSWIGGGGVLGISYTLFGNLASKGEKGGDEEAIWEALIKMPSLLVLDEGHVPRNVNGCIGNAIKKVTTKRCIMLSGTIFQNNFEELKTTLGLVDPGFHKMDRNSWTKLTEGKDELEELRSRLDPYVHYHKGSVLQKSIPGLKDTMIFLRPGELQQSLMDACKNEKEIFLALTYLISLISVHPSALMVDEKTKFSKSQAFSLFKNKLIEIESDLDEGVKIKFVMNLIQLADAVGERVLVFSHYRYPLLFIKKQLETHFSWKEGREVLYMDGKLEEKHRQQSISSLNNSSSEAKVLLASLKACSEGISLVGASRVVLLTTAWNPSVERQAISRAYRLGQKKVVYVYRLITSGMEVRQYELQAKKDQISQLIFSPVDEHAGASETSSEIFEDNILEQMQNLESFKNSFEKIIHQPKESDFLENFRFNDL